MVKSNNREKSNATLQCIKWRATIWRRICEMRYAGCVCLRHEVEVEVNQVCVLQVVNQSINQSISRMTISPTRRSPVPNLDFDLDFLRFLPFSPPSSTSTDRSVDMLRGKFPLPGMLLFSRSQERTPGERERSNVWLRLFSRWKWSVSFDSMEALLRPRVMTLVVAPSRTCSSSTITSGNSGADGFGCWSSSSVMSGSERARLSSSSSMLAYWSSSRGMGMGVLGFELDLSFSCPCRDDDPRRPDFSLGRVAWLDFDSGVGVVEWWQFCRETDCVIDGRRRVACAAAATEATELKMTSVARVRYPVCEPLISISGSR